MIHDVGTRTKISNPLFYSPSKLSVTCDLCSWLLEIMITGPGSPLLGSVVTNSLFGRPKMSVYFNFLRNTNYLFLILSLSLHFYLLDIFFSEKKKVTRRIISWSIIYHSESLWKLNYTPWLRNLIYSEIFYC